MQNPTHEVIAARKSRLKELIDQGVVGYDNLVRSVQNLPEFANLRATSLYEIILRYSHELGLKSKRRRGGRNIPKAIRHDRKIAIQQLLQTGVTDHNIMARSLQQNPALDGLNIFRIATYLRKHAPKNTIGGADSDKVTAHTPAVKTRTVQIEVTASSFDAVLQSPQFRASVRSLRLAEYDRMVSLLRPLWQKSETELHALRETKRGLDLKVSELENHRCPDRDAQLREENSKLKNRITFLERRVDALSQLTKPRQLNENHIAISAQGR